MVKVKTPKNKEKVISDKKKNSVQKSKNKTVKKMLHYQNKIQQMWAANGGSYSTKIKGIYRKSWPLRSSMSLDVIQPIKNLTIQWPPLSTFKGVQDDYIQMHGEDALKELRSSILEKADQIWNFGTRISQIRPEIIENGMLMAKGSESHPMETNVKLLNLLFFIYNRNQYPIFNYLIQSKRSKKSSLLSPNSPFLYFPIRRGRGVKKGKKFAYEAHTDLFKENGKIHVIVEKKHIFSVTNLFDGFLALHFLYHVFRLEYTEETMTFYEFMDYMAGIPQTLFFDDNNHDQKKAEDEAAARELKN